MSVLTAAFWSSSLESSFESEAFLRNGSSMTFILSSERLAKYAVGSSIPSNASISCTFATCDDISAESTSADAAVSPTAVSSVCPAINRDWSA